MQKKRGATVVVLPSLQIGQYAMLVLYTTVAMVTGCKFTSMKPDCWFLVYIAISWLVLIHLSSNLAHINTTFQVTFKLVLIDFMGVEYREKNNHTSRKGMGEIVRDSPWLQSYKYFVFPLTSISMLTCTFIYFLFIYFLGADCSIWGTYVC